MSVRQAEEKDVGGGGARAGGVGEPVPERERAVAAVLRRRARRRGWEGSWRRRRPARSREAPHPAAAVHGAGGCRLALPRRRREVTGGGARRRARPRSPSAGREAEGAARAEVWRREGREKRKERKGRGGP